MPISQEQFDEIQKLAETIESAMNDLNSLLKAADKRLYEQWKAYGKQVTSEFLSMGPSLPEVVEKLEAEIVEDDEDSEEADV